MEPTTRRNRSRSLLPVSAINRIAILASVAGAVIFAVSLPREMASAQVISQLQTTYLLPTAQTVTTPRGSLAAALLQLRRAEADQLKQGEVGSPLQAQASELQLLSLQNVRPYWGELDIGLTITALARFGAHSDTTLQRLSRTYVSQPFSRSAARWRTQLAFANWDALPNSARRSVLNEAVWISELDGATRRAIFRQAHGTSAYFDLAAAWLSARREVLRSQARPANRPTNTHRIN